MSDIELELMAFLGTDFGASVVAEIGEEVVGYIFTAGAMAQAGITRQDFCETFGDLINTNKKETA